MFHSVLQGLLVVQALMLIVSMLYIATSLHFEDRIVGTNLVGTIVINFIVMLSAFMGEGYGMDIALVYAFLSFLAVVVLCRLMAVQHVERQLSALERKEKKAAAKAAKGADEEKRRAERERREEESRRLQAQLDALQNTPKEGGGNP